MLMLAHMLMMMMLMMLMMLIMLMMLNVDDAAGADIKCET